MRGGFFVADAHAHIFREDELIGIPPAVRSYKYIVEDMIARMDRWEIDLFVVIAHARFGWNMERFCEEHDAIMSDAAVDIYFKGVNQLEEVSSPAFVTVYLPSGGLGSAKLPIPHPEKVP